MREGCLCMVKSPTSSNPQRKETKMTRKTTDQITAAEPGKKIIESALDNVLRRNYSNNPMQLGFQKGKSTEGAILRATELQRRGQRCIAVLDLTAAYDSVPRRFLKERMRRTLPKSLCEMAEEFLVPPGYAQ